MGGGGRGGEVGGGGGGRRGSGSNRDPILLEFGVIWLHSHAKSLRIVNEVDRKPAECHRH